MKVFLRFAMMLFLAACVIQTAEAVTIDYTLTNTGDESWQYDYKIINNSDDYLHGFSIYFDERYKNLDLVVGFASWDELEPGFGVWQDDWMTVWGDPYIWGSGWKDGEISMLNLAAGLAPGEILEGLSIVFDWFGLSETPGRQLFELFDANFDSLDIFGYTSTSAAPPVVPEPQTFMLFGTGLIGLAAYYRRNRKQ